MAVHVVRKRDRWTRHRAKRSRPKTPAPKTGWIIAELASITGLTVGTIRDYTRRKLIAPSEFRGNLTRYQRRELLRLLAIPRLQYEQRLSLTAIKQFLDRLGDSEVLAWLMERPLSPAAAAALGIATAAPPAPAPATAGTSAGSIDPGLTATASTMWYRMTLLPGLELMCASTASPAVRSAAQKIFEEYVGK